MDIFTINKLFLFIAFIVPGFVSLKAYEIFIPTQKIDSTKVLIEAITYSCINYALLFPFIIYFADHYSALPLHLNYGYAVLILFIMPIIWAYSLKIIRIKLKSLQHPIQKPWDFIFSQQKQYYIIITLKNGDKIAGTYGENSFTSSFPVEEQIFLEETWVLNENGGFERLRDSTKGTIILFNEMVSLELFTKD